MIGSAMFQILVVTFLFTQLLAYPTNSSVSQNNLQELTEALYLLDTENNAYFKGHVTVNNQAPPLVQATIGAYDLKTVDLLLNLYGHFELDVDKPEKNLPGKVPAINAFVSEVFNTPIMKKVQTFLKAAGYTLTLEKFKDIWFGEYSRGRGKSTGFEHVFLAELNTKLNAPVLGFHNWLFLDAEEIGKNEVRYVTYELQPKKQALGDRGKLVEFKRFSWWPVESSDFLFKGFSTMFVGTSPELELGLYTVCFYIHRDGICPVKMNEVRFTIETTRISGTGDHFFVGSAFPLLP